MAMINNTDLPITERIKVLLLLNCLFKASDYGSVKPLTPNEYGYLARWLSVHGYDPVQLLDTAVLNSVFEKWQTEESHLEPKARTNLKRLDNTIAAMTKERLSALMQRGASLSFALEKWGRAGIWVIDRSNEYYPKKIKALLKDQSPALLFGVGRPELLQNAYVGYVGARDADTSDEQATNVYVQKTAALGYGVVSGAAKGIDSFAMHASIHSGQPTVGVVADSLYQKSATKEWRTAIQRGLLTLVSPFFPEARFTPANAMARNKFIYMMSLSTVVVRSNATGGTWEGAVENLKKGYATLLVSTHCNPNYDGNRQLLENTLKNAVQSAKTISLDMPDSAIEALIRGTDSPAPASPEPMENDLLSQPVEAENRQQLEYSPIAVSQSLDIAESSLEQDQQQAQQSETKISGSSDNTTNTNERSSLIDVFYEQLAEMIHTKDGASVTWQELQQEFAEFELISKTSMQKWIDVLIADGRLVQPTRKKAYEIANASQNLFGK